MALLMGGLVLLAGAAFVHLGLRARQAEEWTALAATAKEAGTALQAALLEEYERAREVVRRLEAAPSLDEFSRLAEEVAHASDRTAVAVTVENTLQLYGVEFSVEDRRRLSADLAGEVEWLSVVGPYQASEGRWFLFLRVPPLRLARAVGVPVVSSVAIAVAVERLTEKSGLARLPSRGFDYVLHGSSPSSLMQAVVRSTAFALSEPAQSSVLVGADVWSLALARRGGPTPWHAAIVSAMLVATLALGLALLAHDVAGRVGRVHAELDKHRRRLRETERRLLDEVQQRSEVEHQFANAGFHDVLTGLPNRRFFVNSITRALERLRHQADAHVAVFGISFDRFKSINETLGYRAGDEVLTSAAQRVMAALQPSDPVLARIGGDQFGLLIVGLPDTAAAEGVAQRLHDAVSRPFQIGRETVLTTASVGVSFRRSGLAQADELLREADIALSRAEGSGRGRTVRFDQQAADELALRHQLETDLTRALEREEFRVFYQPIVELPTNRVIGMESLIRWHHPSQGLLAPGSFIGVAEKAGLIVPINRWVLREACRQARTWRGRLGPDRDFYVTVNLSGHDLREPDLCDFVASIVRQASLAPDMLRLEVTESVLIEDVHGANELVTGLRQIGVPLLLDDFGTGYSSLSYLTHFRVDYLKIDKAFVRNVAATPRSDALLRSIVHLANDLGITPIAEGIETRDDLARLLDLGCPFGQGYYFSSPVPAEKAEPLIVAGNVAGQVGGSGRSARRGDGQAVA